MERGRNQVRNVFPAHLLNPKRMGHCGFDVGPLLAALPPSSYVVLARHSGDLFFDFIVFRQSFSASDMLEPLILGLRGYQMAHLHECICKLTHWQVTTLERGVGFPITSFQDQIDRWNKDITE